MLALGSNPDSSVSPLRDETTMACWSRYAHAAQNRPHSRQPPGPATVGGSRDGGRMCLQLPLRVICSVTGTAGGTGRPALPGPSVGLALKALHAGNPSDRGKGLAGDPATGRILNDLSAPSRHRQKQGFWAKMCPDDTVVPEPEVIPLDEQCPCWEGAGEPEAGSWSPELSSSQFPNAVAC